MQISPRHPLAGAYLRATYRPIVAGALGPESVVLRKATDLVKHGDEVPPADYFRTLLTEAVGTTNTQMVITSMRWIGLPCAIMWRIDQGHPQIEHDPVELFLQRWQARKAMVASTGWGNLEP